MKTRLGTVLGSGGGFAKTAEDVNGFNQTSTETSTSESSTSVEAPAESGGGSEGDALSYFEKLAAED